jgi:aminoglycoside phosphotransferase (APT) family kinase protein
MEQSPEPLIERCRLLLLELGIAGPDDRLTVSQLTGGVASDIAMVKTGERTCCVKFALAKLRVQHDWFAPVHRNAAEYAWLQVAARVAPESAVSLFGRSDTYHGFAMEFLEGDDVYLWKDALLNESPIRGEAAKVGELLGRIHAESASPNFDASAFDNLTDFLALRIDPYLDFTARRHPDLKDAFSRTVKWLRASSQVLVHGDVSPKNILFRDHGPVLLDAECATMGDASFDPSFCMNHLILKAIHRPASARQYLDQVNRLWDAYSAQVDWESVVDLERRICQLLPCLMLARIDGKSPVEYLAESDRAQVRRIARFYIAHPVNRIQDLINGISSFPAEAMQ